MRQGFGRLTGSIIPRTLEFALPLEPLPYDPAQAKRLLAEAGYPHGFEGGDLTPFPPLLALAEAIANNLGRSASARRCGPWSGQHGSWPGERNS